MTFPRVRVWLPVAAFAALLGTLLYGAHLLTLPPKHLWSRGSPDWHGDSVFATMDSAAPLPDATIVRIWLGDEYEWHLHQTKAPSKWRQWLTWLVGPSDVERPDCAGHYKRTGRTRGSRRYTWVEFERR